jgi:serine protease Do
MRLAKANLKWLAALACAVLLAGAAIGWGDIGSRPHTQASDVRQLSTVFREIAKEARGSVVRIETTGKPVTQQLMSPFGLDDDSPFGEMFKNQPQLREFFRQQQRQRQFTPHGMGSGFVIDPSGIIMTNRHVVADAAEVTVKFPDGREFRATDIKTDPRTDVAIVHVKGAGPLKALPMGNSDEMEAGDWVLAVGSPFGLDQTVTAGIISAKGRGIGKTDREDYLQTDAAINPGNSGGPLINLDGQVIGINTAISTRSGGYDGVGFAIPINMARWVANQLITKGSVQRAYLGVMIQPVNGTLAQVLKLPPGQGAIVAELKPNSPAAKAGLQSQDVILDFNGQKVTGPKDLQGIVEQTEVGKTYNMTILRDGKEMTLPVTLQEMPKSYTRLASEGKEGGTESETPDKETTSFDELGLEIRALTPELAEKLQLKKDVKGVVVSSVKPGSLGADAGLSEGMVIERVNRVPVSNPEEFQAAMKKASLQNGVIFQVRTPLGTNIIAIRKG